jgi:lysophospholipase L1-like esterase
VTTRILCFGDSNTWGYEPGTGLRYSYPVRWPGMLQSLLGQAYTVIEEGLNGRTTVWNDPLMPGRNGKEYLLPCIESHRPFDLLIISLGMNDLKVKFSASPQDIARGLAMLVKTLRNAATEWNGNTPRVLLVAPPRIGKLTELSEMFTGAAEKSSHLSAWIERTARELDCEFLDAASLITTDDRDGIHLSADAHKTLAEAIAQKVLSLSLEDDKATAPHLR